MAEYSGQVQVKDEEEKDSLIDQRSSFALISLEQIRMSLQNTFLCQEQDKKIQTLNHEAHYEWLGEQLPNVNSVGQKLIRVFVVTWNMHGLLIGSQLHKLLRSDELKHHIVVFASQECQRSIGYSIFCDSKEDWEHQIQIELGPEYAMIAANKLNALHLCVFSHTSIVHLVDDKQIATFATGFLNVVGNKGAVGISVRIGTKSFIFLNNHLASGQDVQEERNREFRKIQTEFPFEKDSTLNLEKKFDYTFWMGDFNSRIDDKKMTIDTMCQQSFFDLLMKDQLLNSRKRLDMYQNFSEGMIMFPPSYKLVPNDYEYARFKHWRIPGWTDRILFHENKSLFLSNTKSKRSRIQPLNKVEEEGQIIQQNADNLVLNNYDSATDIWGSDHRPVFAQFTILI